MKDSFWKEAKQISRSNKAIEKMDNKVDFKAFIKVIMFMVGSVWMAYLLKKLI
jgi:hypothetical protein